MDKDVSPAQEAMDQVVAGLQGPISRKDLVAAAAERYRGDARSPAQAISSHLRWRGDLVQVRSGWYDRLDHIMDGTLFRLTLTRLFVQFPWVPPLFFEGYVEQLQPRIVLVDQEIGDLLSPVSQTQFYRVWREGGGEEAASRERSRQSKGRPSVQERLFGTLIGEMPGPWGPILTWRSLTRDYDWFSMEPILSRHKAKAGDVLFFRVESALEDRVSVTFRRKASVDRALAEERDRAFADRLALFLDGKRQQIPAREAVPVAYSGLPWVRDARCPAEHWWVVAETDPRMRTVDGQAIAEATYWRREDWSSGRSQPERPDVSTAPPGEADKEYLFKVALQWRPGTWRTIALRGNQTLEDLHDAIQDAFGWDNDHLYAFYMSGKAYDDATEYGDPRGESDAYADEAAIGALGLRPNKRFLYVFDFGDDLRHEIRLVSTAQASPERDYPVIVEEHGEAPSQYGDEDEDGDGDES